MRIGRTTFFRYWSANFGTYFWRFGGQHSAWGTSDRPDPSLASDRDNYSIARWNYHWSADYGSPRFSVQDLKPVGQDSVPIQSLTLEEGGRSVFLKIAGLKPVRQMQIAYHLKTEAGQPLVGSIFHTIHRLEK